MYSRCTKSTIKNQNTQLTEKSVGITRRIFPDYPIEKSQYPIDKKISGYYPIHQNFLSGALRFFLCRCAVRVTHYSLSINREKNSAVSVRFYAYLFLVMNKLIKTQNS